MTPPVLKAGWQTDQSANSKDLTFNYNPKRYQSNPRLGGINVFPNTNPRFEKPLDSISTAKTSPIDYSVPGKLFGSVSGSA
jgi:hypothetical protein